MVDSDISEVSLLPITEVAKIRAELGIPSLPEENVIPLDNREAAILFFKNGLNDFSVSKYSHLSIEEVVKIRAEIGIPAPPEENVNAPGSTIKVLREAAIMHIKDGLDDSLISKYSRLSIEDVTKIRAEAEAGSKTK
jgi:hypothetical protein